MRKGWVSIGFILVFLSACSYEEGSSASKAVSGGPPGAVKIISHKDGDTVAANTAFVMEYEVTRSSGGDHLHIYIDGGKPDLVSEMKGSYEVATLSAGEHTIAIKEMTSGHSPTGSEAVIKIIAQ